MRPHHCGDVADALARIQKEIERQPLLGPGRPTRLELGDLFFGPWLMTRTVAIFFDKARWIRFHPFFVYGEIQKLPQQLKPAVRLRRRRRLFRHLRLDPGFRQKSDWFVAVLLPQILKDASARRFRHFFQFTPMF